MNTAAPGLFKGQLLHQLGGSGAGLALGQKGRAVQPRQKLCRSLAGEQGTEQVAAPLGRQLQRAAAQDELSGQGCLGRQRPWVCQGGGALAAGYQAYPQPVSFQAKGRRQLKIPQGSQGDGGTPIVNQYLTPLINKMLFHNTKLSAIIITTKRRTVK